MKRFKPAPIPDLGVRIIDNEGNVHDYSDIRELMQAFNVSHFHITGCIGASNNGHAIKNGPFAGVRSITWLSDGPRK